ncbi:hypothetical protein MHYP_G00302990 [Metynnis hypsauchen]
MQKESRDIKRKPGTIGNIRRPVERLRCAVFTLQAGTVTVVFEATVSAEQKGYIGLDDIVLLNYPCSKKGNSLSSATLSLHMLAVICPSSRDRA